MKQTLKHTALIAGVLLAISSTAHASCTNTSQCNNPCPPPPEKGSASCERCLSPWGVPPGECMTGSEAARRFSSGTLMEVFGAAMPMPNTPPPTTNPLARLFNAIVDIVRPIAPPTIAPIARTAAPIAAPNATRAYNNTLSALMQLIEAQRRAAATTPETLIDENGEEYTCVPEGSGRLDCAEPKEETLKEDDYGNKHWVCEEPPRNGNTGGNNGICYMPQSEKDKCTGSFQQIQDCYMRYYDENCEGA